MVTPSPACTDGGNSWKTGRAPDCAPKAVSSRFLLTAGPSGPSRTSHCTDSRPINTCEQASKTHFFPRVDSL